jgi:hypothetical protein
VEEGDLAKGKVSICTPLSIGIGKGNRGGTPARRTLLDNRFPGTPSVSWAAWTRREAGEPVRPLGPRPSVRNVWSSVANGTRASLLGFGVDQKLARKPIQQASTNSMIASG